MILHIKDRNIVIHHDYGIDIAELHARFPRRQLRMGESLAISRAIGIDKEEIVCTDHSL